MPVPPTDPFSQADSDSDGNWLLWPMKCWPLWIRIPLILLLILIFGWITLTKTQSAPVSAPTPVLAAIEQIVAPAPVDCTGPFTLMGTTLEQFAACADVIGVERHELNCATADCFKWRRGCPVFDDDGRLLYLLMPGEYIAILQDGRLIRSDGELPTDKVGATLCAEAPP